MPITTTHEVTPEKTPEHVEAAALAKNDREVKKTEEKQQQSEAEKGPHDGKYFVVKGGTCVCDKAEDPTKTAKIVVTSHTKHIINDGKLAVTEADTTMDPPAVTYGKCTLKPSSVGNLPCAPAFAPKWEKTYEKKKVQGKTVLTEISTLQCMTGGKITIQKHGQKNSVSKEHSENSNDAEQMLINPAVYKPKLAPAYPTIENITLKTISDRPDHKPVASDTSKKVEKIILRKDEEGSFVAKIKKGNVDLTSWAMYDDKGAKIQGVERKGTEFECKFLAVGHYKIEAYGVPITPEADDTRAEKKADKKAQKENEEKHTLEVEVIVNKLKGKTLQTIDGDTFTRDQELNNKTGKIKLKIIEHRLRKDFPASFQATFVLAPNAQEIERIKMYVTDGLGNVLQDMGSQTGNSFMFVPHNTGAKYIVVAEYTQEDGVINQQIFEAVTESLSVVSITNAAQVVRPETPMTFTAQTQYKTTGNLTGAENEIIKWNLNGALVGTGATITLDGRHFISEGNYVVEGYVTTANATNTGIAGNLDKRKDDWHFEVKKNDVVDFGYLGMPKVGKKTQLTVTKYIMPPIDGETTVWTIFGKTVTGQTIDITPATAGIAHVACKINYMPGKKLTLEVKQAIVNDVMFTDSNGIEIKKASWGQKINVWINHKNLEDEDFIFTVIHENTTVLVQTIKAFNQYLIPLSLDEFMHKKVGKIGKLQIKITTPNLKVIGDGVAFPKVSFDVQDTPEVYEAHIGSEDGKDKHTIVDYDKVSWFYAKSRGIKPTENLRLEIRQSMFGLSFTPDSDKLLLSAEPVRPDDSGMIKIRLPWSEVNPKIPIRYAYAVVKDSKGKILHNTGYVFGNIVALVQTSTVVKLAEYKSAVMVKGDPVNKSEKNGVCECEERIKAFMRMLRVGEDTGEENKKGVKKDPQKGYSTAFGGEVISDLSSHPMKNYGGSTAAGAYQIMRYTYAWLGGSKLEWTGTYFKILDIYEKEHDYRKKYNISDYQPESQDKLCICLMKDKKGMIELIIEGKIEDATRKYGSSIWASLPYKGDISRYDYNGKPQPVTSMSKCIELYNKYLKEELAGKTNLHLKKGFLKEFDIKCNCKNEKSSLETNEFGLVQVTKLGNPYIVNSGIEDSYSYTKKDGTSSPVGKHGDDWMLPKKAKAFSDAVYKLVKEYPLQKIYLGDCSAYNPSKNLGHSATGAHSNGNAFDCKFLKTDGSGSNDISNLTADEIKLSGRFITILKESGLFTSFYTDNGKIPGSVHSADHKDHIHGN
jgi:muramidase (phage lysozyme)